MSFKNQNTEALHFIRRITLLLLLSFAYPQEEEEVEILNLEASTHNIMRTAGVVSKFEPFAFRRFYAKLHLIAELHIKNSLLENRGINREETNKLCTQCLGIIPHLSEFFLTNQKPRHI